MFFKNTIFYTFGQLLPKIAGIALLPLYTNYLSPEEFGIINAMVALELVLIVFFTATLERSVMRIYWDYKSQNEKKELIGSIIIMTLLIGFIMIFMLFIFSKSLNLIFISIPFFPFFVYAIMITFLKSFTLVLKAVLVVEKKSIYLFINFDFSIFDKCHYNHLFFSV